MITVYVKEQSWIAGIAATVLKTRRVAIVINRTIHLHNTTQKDFVNNKPWLLHELKHVAQYEQYGTVRFILLYLYESVRKGYANNRFEVEARTAEYDTAALNKYMLL